MKVAQLVALVLIPATVAATPAYAKCRHEPMPVVLETVVVTPNGSYTQSEWQRRQDAQAALAATAVTLPTVVVTPDYTSADAPRHQYASERSRTAGSTAQASAAPGAPMRPSLINFLRRLFN